MRETFVKADPVMGRERAVPLVREIVGRSVERRGDAGEPATDQSFRRAGCRPERNVGLPLGQRDEGVGDDLLDRDRRS